MEETHKRSRAIFWFLTLFFAGAFIFFIKVWPGAQWVWLTFPPFGTCFAKAMDVI
jgi:hypothetical protein